MTGTESNNPLSAVEVIKQDSNYLRGTLKQGLVDPLTGAIAESDTHLSKFHGIYQQDDRDVRSDRQRQKLEPDFCFMIRARTVAGRFSAAQWLQLDALARRYAGGVIRLTTRQTFQFHGVKKRDLKACVQGINALAIDTLAACGDVNRNVMCSQNFDGSEVAAKTWNLAVQLSDFFTPKTKAYAETWLEAETSPATDEEPFYGPTYLPRKFKMAIAIPPINDVDVFTQDLGLIAIEQDGQLQGFNLSVGGGMGVTHNDATTYPRLGSIIGFVTSDQVLNVAEHIVAIQRDHGNRRERKNARLKYTIDRLGLNWFKDELQRRSGITMSASKPATFTSNSDKLGWQKLNNGTFNLTLFVPGGRILDDEENTLLSFLQKIASVHIGEICFTANQNLVIAGISKTVQADVVALLDEHQVGDRTATEPVLAKTMACVAFPTCALAMAEAERALPEITALVSNLVSKHKIEAQAPSLRISGCPNGCSRPYVAEIALVGKALGRYNLMLGGSPVGDRLNWLHKENIDLTQINEELDNLLGNYAANRKTGEYFGDFLFRVQNNPNIAIEEILA